MSYNDPSQPVTIDWSSPDRPVVRPAAANDDAMTQEEADHMITTSQSWYDLNESSDGW